MTTAQPGRLGQLLTFVASNVMLSGVATVLGMLLTRALGPTESGRLAVVNQFIYAVTPLLTFGLVDAVAVVGPSLGTEVANRATQRVRLIVGSATCVAIAAAFLLRSGQYLAPELAGALVPLAMSVLAGVLVAVEGAKLRAKAQFSALTVLASVRDMVSRGTALALVLFFGLRDYRGPVYIAAMGSVAVLAWLARSSHWSRRARESLPVEIVRFASRSYLGLLCYTMIQSIDIAAVRMMRDATTVGVYAAGTRVPAVAYSLVVTQLSIPMTYYFASEEWRERRAEVAVRATVAFTLVTGIAATTLAGVARWVVAIVFGSAFLDAVGPMQVSCFTMVFSAASCFIPILLNVTSRPQYVVAFSMLQLACATVLSLVLVPRFGAVGAALALMVATGLQAMALALYAWRHMAVHLVGRTLSLSCACFLALAVCTTRFVVLCPVVFGASVLAFGFVRVGEVRGMMAMVLQAIKGRRA